MKLEQQELEKALITSLSNANLSALEKAVDGWVMVKYYDQKFLDSICPQQMQEYFANKTKKPQKKHPFNQKLASNKRDFLAEALSIKDPTQRFEFCKNLVDLKHEFILHDSYQGLSTAKAQKEACSFLSGDKINIAIIGAGFCGLYLANMLKNHLGERVNILLCEKRAYQRGVKKPYSRSWLTNLPLQLFTAKIDHRVTEIIDSLGVEFYVGGIINMLETLMLISCKNMGVSCYYDPEFNPDFLQNSEADIIFDATAGKLEHLYPLQNKGANIDVSYAEKVAENTFEYAGLRLLTAEKDPKTQYVLKNEKAYFEPMSNGQKLNYPMCKITNIPAQYMSQVLEFAQQNNVDNIFYVWQGKLLPEFNHGLVLVNLTMDAFMCLDEIAEQPIAVADMLKKHVIGLKKLDKRLVSLFNLLVDIDSKNSANNIFLEPPFFFKPNIRFCEDKLTKLHNVPLVPIGDALFTGHVKNGNGLPHHMLLAEKLVFLLEHLVSSPDEVWAKGLKMHQDGNLQGAEYCYLETIRRQPNGPAAYNNLAIICMQKEDLNNAVAYFQNAINLDCTQMHHWTGMLDCLLMQQRHQDAKTVLAHAASKGVDCPEFAEYRQKLEPSLKFF